VIFIMYSLVQYSREFLIYAISKCNLCWFISFDFNCVIVFLHNVCCGNGCVCIYIMDFCEKANVVNTMFIVAVVLV